MQATPRHENFSATLSGALLKKREIAQRLRVSERTADRWIASGVIPPADIDATKLTKRWTPATLNQKFPGVF